MSGRHIGPAKVVTKKANHMKWLWSKLVANLRIQSGFLFQRFQVIRCAVGHPGVPWYAKLVAACSICYVFSPVQLIPNFIPVIGQLDDVLVITLGLKLLKRWVPKEVLKQCGAEAGTTLSRRSAIRDETREKALAI
jgi:uncharacterized membrane protein YkvA (DUF1232 family)